MKKTFIAFFLAVLCLLATVTASTNNPSFVNFDFDGLGVLAFGDVSRASLGLLDVTHHTPNITIKRIENGKTTTINTVTAKELKNRVVTISLPNSILQPKRYYSTDMTKDATDFRWTLDLESDLFQKQLYLKDNFFAKIHFTTGTFSAANLSEEKFTFVSGSKIHSFNRQIAQPVAKIELQQGQALAISGLDKPISLPYKAGVSYQVSITNLPPPDHADMNHFLFYYDAVKTDVPRFVPVMVKKASYFPRPVVCDMVVLSKSFID